jgi:hypothetical protein
MIYGRGGISECTAFSSLSMFYKLSISLVSMLFLLYPFFTDTSIELCGYVVFNFCLHGCALMFIRMKNVTNKVVEKNETSFIRISD